MVSIMCYVQSLLGRGHLVRMVRLCEALRSGGFRVILVDGGGDLPAMHADIERYSLPSIASLDGNFSALIGEDGEVIDESYKQRRRSELLSIYGEVSPQIILLEGYPLARRAFAFELDYLLEAALSDRVLRITSLRDIVVFNAEVGGERKRAKILDKLACIDRVWVHGDEQFCPLRCSLPFADDFSAKTLYSGYIAGEDGGGDVLGADRIIVSAGSGAVGDFYYDLWDLAFHLPEYRWLFLLGEKFPRRAEFMARPMVQHIEIEPNSSDVRSLLRGARLAISQAGYNTVMDIAVSRVASLLMPFSGRDSSETEQPLRAQLLQQNCLAKILPCDLKSMTPQSLKALIEEACCLNSPDRFPMDFASALDLSEQMHMMWRDHAAI